MDMKYPHGCNSQRKVPEIFEKVLGDKSKVMSRPIHYAIGKLYRFHTPMVYTQTRQYDTTPMKLCRCKYYRLDAISYMRPTKETYGENYIEWYLNPEYEMFEFREYTPLFSIRTWVWGISGPRFSIPRDLMDKYAPESITPCKHSLFKTTCE